MHVRAKGKGLYAGPAAEQTTKRGPGKKRKLPTKKNAVVSSNGELAKNTAACFWRDNTSLLQRKIQQLEKQFRPFDVYTAGPKNQLLLSDDPSKNDVSVISYDSKGPVQDLNCCAKNRIDDSPIACRHLTYAFATGGFGVKTRANRGDLKEPGSKFNAVASIDNIQNNAAIKTDQQLKKTPVWYGIPKVAVYFDAEHIGQALYDVWMNKGAGDQASHGKPSQTWLFHTEKHAMAIKLVSTAGSAIKIEWYDPNYTTIVRRVIVLNKEILQQLTLNQFVSKPNQTHYAIDRAGILMSTDAVESENHSDATVLAALTPSLLYLLMRHGQLNNSSMDSLKTALSEVRSDNPGKLIELLAAISGDGTPGLFVALQNGHQEAISAYVEVIKQLRDTIEPEVIKELLAAKREDGSPGLFAALQEGHQEAVSAYVEGIKQLRDIIEPEVIKELLAAKIGVGTPGLYMALKNGQQEAVRAYVEGIKQLRDIIEPEVIWELLAAKSRDGKSGLCGALENGHQEDIGTYLQGIKQFADIIEPEDLKELLTGKSENGTPGLFMARREGRKKAIRAYVKGVKQFGGIIEPKVVKELLAGKRGKPESVKSRLRNQPVKTSGQGFSCKIL